MSHVSGDVVGKMRGRRAERGAAVREFPERFVPKGDGSLRSNRYAKVARNSNDIECVCSGALEETSAQVEGAEGGVVDHLNHRDVWICNPVASGSSMKTSMIGGSPRKMLMKAAANSSANAINGPWGPGWECARARTTGSNRIAESEPEAGQPWGCCAESETHGRRWSRRTRCPTKSRGTTPGQHQPATQEHEDAEAPSRAIPKTRK